METVSTAALMDRVTRLAPPPYARSERHSPERPPAFESSSTTSRSRAPAFDALDHVVDGQRRDGRRPSAPPSRRRSDRRPRMCGQRDLARRRRRSIPPPRRRSARAGGRAGSARRSASRPGCPAIRATPMHVALRGVAVLHRSRGRGETRARSRGRSPSGRSAPSRRRRPSARGHARQGVSARHRSVTLRRSSASAQRTVRSPPAPDRSQRGQRPAPIGLARDPHAQLAIGAAPCGARRRGSTGGRRGSRRSGAAPRRASRRTGATTGCESIEGSHTRSLTLTHSCRPMRECVRPRPELLTPPHGVWHGAMAEHVVVDPDHAGLQLAPRSARPGPVARSTPMLRARTRESFASVIASYSESTTIDGEHRTEDLLAHDPHLVGDAGQHRGRVERAMLQSRRRGCRASAAQRRAGIDRVLDEFVHELELIIATPSVRSRCPIRVDRRSAASAPPPPGRR